MQSLNGTWKVTPDATNIGRAERWFETIQPQAQDVPVPGIIQQVFPTHQGVAWYWLTFTPDRLPAANEQALLRFGIPQLRFFDIALYLVLRQGRQMR